MKQIYRQIFFSTTKYVLLRNFFMVVTGIISIFIIRLLGPSEYGKYSLVWNLISTLGPILSLGWLTTLAKFVPERPEFHDKAKLFSQSFFTVLIVSLLFLIAVNFIHQFLPKILPAEIREIILVFSLFTVLVAFFNVMEGFWRGLGKFNEFVIIDGLRSNIGNFLGLLFLIFGFVSYKTIISINFFVSVIFLILLFLMTKKYLLFRHIGKIEKQVVELAATLLLGQFIYMLSVNVDVLLLRGILKDTHQVGYYSVGIRIPKIVEVMFIAQLPAPMLYYFSSSETMYLKGKILKFSCRMLGFIFGIVGLIFFSCAELVVPFLFGTKFGPSVSVFKFFSLALPLLAFLILISPYYVSENKAFVLIVIHFLTVIVASNVLNIFLIPKYKYFAPVIGYLTGLVLFSTVVCVDCNNRYNINLFRDLGLLCLFLTSGVLVEEFLRLPSFLVFILLFFVTKTVSLDDIRQFVSIITVKSS